MVSDMEKRILDAATKRFGQFGFDKTTMAEIASDCRMSAGNIYRYYKGKEDIGVAITAQYFQDREQTVRDAINQKDLSFEERFRAYVHAMLEHAHGRFAGQPQIFGLVDFITGQRCEELIVPHEHRMREILSEFLNEGNAQGVFKLENVYKTVESIRTALTTFELPQCMEWYTKEQLTQMADGVTNLIFSGILAR